MTWIGGQIKQFCKRGHDTFETGRDSSRMCRVCRAEERKGWSKRRSDGTPNPRFKVPAAPLRTELARRIRSLDNMKTRPADPAGVRQLAQLHADRFHGNATTAQRQLLRLLRDQESVWEETADEWCVTLGTHLAILYPELYIEDVIEVSA